jgi:hypothetical protein
MQRALLHGIMAAATVQAVQLDVTDNGEIHARQCDIPTPLTLHALDSIRAAASTIAYNMMTYYTGNLPGNEPGLLPQPYYWWEAGAMWGGMVEYWHFTGDRTYNDVVAQAIFAQKSPTNDFLMPEQVYDTVCILMSPLHHEGTFTERHVSQGQR